MKTLVKIGVFFCNFLFNCTSGCQIWWFFPAFAFRWRSSTFFRYDESFTTLCLHILQRISTFCSLSHLLSDMMKVLWRCVCISPEIFNFLSINFHFISLSFKNMLENPDNSTWMSQHFAYVIRKYKDKGWGTIPKRMISWKSSEWPLTPRIFGKSYCGFFLSRNND